MIDETIKTTPYKDTSYLSIPHALIAYNSTMLYNTHLILESQLSQVAPESEMYAELNELSQRVFDSWVTLGYREGDGDGVRV